MRPDLYKKPGYHATWRNFRKHGLETAGLLMRELRGNDCGHFEIQRREESARLGDGFIVFGGGNGIGHDARAHVEPGRLLPANRGAPADFIICGYLISRSNTGSRLPLMMRQ